MESRPIPEGTIANPFGPLSYPCACRLGLHTKPGSREATGRLNTAPSEPRRRSRMRLAASVSMRAAALPT
jgi:hypothetical protein